MFNNIKFLFWKTVLYDSKIFEGSWLLYLSAAGLGGYWGLSLKTIIQIKNYVPASALWATKSISIPYLN